MRTLDISEETQTDQMFFLVTKIEIVNDGNEGVSLSISFSFKVINILSINLINSLFNRIIIT